MFRRLRPGRPSGPAKGTKEPGSGESGRDQGPPPRLELPRHRPPGALNRPHLKPVGQAAKPSDPRAAPRAVSRPVAQPLEQPVRTVIPPYPVSGAAAASTVPPRGAEVKSFGRLMLVGPQICLKAEIKSCERLVVEGIVEGVVSETDRLEVARGGRFQGMAQIESCAIDGDFEGELDVRGVLTLKANGRVAGTVRYGEIEIERGGMIAGDFRAHGGAEISGRTATQQSLNSSGPRPA